MPASISNDQTTYSVSAEEQESTPQPILVITLLAHPDPDRVGEWYSFEPGRDLDLNRKSPLFSPSIDGDRRPLEDTGVSRKSVRLRFEEAGPDTKGARGALLLDARTVSTPVTLGLQPVDGQARVDAAVLRRGVVLVLAKRIALAIRLTHSTIPGPKVEGLIGESAAMRELRQEVHDLAKLGNYNVLLRGESGTGKDIIAKALHQLSPRKNRPYITRDVGALSPSLASAELFGAKEGAFTDARPREGAFRSAHTGTLFLDEIGNAPQEVRSALLRALEAKEILAVGSDRPVPIDVRVISASDADLDSILRVALLNRIAMCEIHVGPLRESIEDIGRLMIHFLRRELKEVGADDRLRAVTTKEKPWLPADLVARFALAEWPGNVRQLRNAIRRLVASGYQADRLSMPPTLEKLLTMRQLSIEKGASSEPETETPSPKRKYRDPNDVRDEEIREALRWNFFEIKPTAQVLNLSRTTLYATMERRGFSLPRNLTVEEIEEAAERHGGRLGATAEFLEVSLRGLRMRMRQLDLLEDGDG